MRYPVLTNTTLRTLGPKLRSGLEIDIAPHAKWVGFGDEISLAGFDELANKFTKAIVSMPDGDKDRLEGQLSVHLFTVLDRLPMEALDDPGFWTYLSLAYFWPFISWRETKAFDKDDDTWIRYVDGRVNTEVVLLRMYLRVKALGGAAFDSLASAVPKATDFWRSHIIRVRTGFAPELTRALVRSQRDDRMSTNPLRVVARDGLNRMWENIVLSFYDDDEADDLVAELRASLLEVPDELADDHAEN